MVGVLLVGISLGDKFLTNSNLITSTTAFGLSLSVIFGLTFIFSGFLALIIISLGSSWGVVESLGYERQSRQNLYIYGLESIPALLLTMFISISIDYILNLMVLFVFVLLMPAILLGIIVQNKKIMFEHAYSKRAIAIYWLTLFIIEISGIVGVFLSF